MKFIGISKDKETGVEIRYELTIFKHEVTCIYKDKYGTYLCTQQGKMMKVEDSVDYLRKELQV